MASVGWALGRRVRVCAEHLGWVRDEWGAQPVSEVIRKAGWAGCLPGHIHFRPSCFYLIAPEARHSLAPTGTASIHTASLGSAL